MIHAAPPHASRAISYIVRTMCRVKYGFLRLHKSQRCERESRHHSTFSTAAMKSFFFLPLLAAAFAVGLPTGNRYIITNRCPSAIDVYLGNSKVARLPNGRSTTQIVGAFNGWIYTNANGGSVDGRASTRAVFSTSVSTLLTSRNLVAHVVAVCILLYSERQGPLQHGNLGVPCSGPSE